MNNDYYHINYDIKYEQCLIYIKNNIINNNKKK